MKSSDVTRAAYVDRYGKGRWAQAVKLASSHRLRAVKNYGLTDHWSAIEWLDLCAPWGFRCPSCGAEGPLTPHHRQPLSQCGSNTIDNILPLCSDCHWYVHEYHVNGLASWLPRQLTLCARFTAGDVVGEVERKNRLDSSAWEEGGQCLGGIMVITEIIPPTKWASLEELCRARDENEENTYNAQIDGLSVEAGGLSFWRHAMARVGTGEGYAVGLQSLERVDIALPLGFLSQRYVEQQRLAREFTVGDGVLFGSAKRPRYGVILGIEYPSLDAYDLPLVDFEHIQLCRWPTVADGVAILKNLDRKGVPAVRPSRCLLSALTKADKAPPMDELWRDIWEAMTTSPMPRSMRRRLKARLSKPATGTK